jgi:hypothetical protein
MATPIANAGSDITISQSDVSSVKTVVIPAATGTDSVGGRSISSFQWTIVSKPSGSNVAFSSGTAAQASPTLSSVDTWGNYLLLCKVTDSYGYSSASTYSTAPTSALLAIRVKSASAELQKLASGERDWSERYAETVGQVEANKLSIASPTVAALTDTSATGPQLNTLVGGGNADTLHTHSGSSLSAATTLVRGGVLLAETPIDAAYPKVMTQARGCLSGHRQTVSGVKASATITVASAAANGVAGAFLPPHTPNGDYMYVQMPYEVPGARIGYHLLVSGTGYPTVATSSNFDWVGGSGSDTVQATNITAALNNSYSGLVATSSSATITVKASQPGAAGNRYAITYAASGSSIMTVGSFSGGSDSFAATSDPVMYFRPEEDITLSSWVIMTSEANTSDMSFQLHKVTTGEATAGSYSDSNKVGTVNVKHGSSADSGNPHYASETFSTVVSVSAGNVLVVRAVSGSATKPMDVWANVFYRRRF